MTPEQALNRLDETVIGDLELKIALSKALERQIAKKPTHEATLFRCCTCPTCGNVIDEYCDFLGGKIRVNVPHCKFCGQRIDWGHL